MVIEYTATAADKLTAIARQLNRQGSINHDETQIANGSHEFILTPVAIEGEEITCKITDTDGIFISRATFTFSTYQLGRLTNIYHEKAERAARRLISAEALIDEIDNS